MPAELCNNGKWKWGETGECKYETQEEAEKDNEDYYENDEDMKNKDKRHIKKVIEDDETITIVFGKSKEWEGVEIDLDDEVIEEIEEESCQNCDSVSCDSCEREKRNIWDKKYNKTNMEKRVYTIESRVEETEDKRDIVIGYGSIFNSRSENLGGFYEYISPSAISQETIDNSDVRALINHDESLILARSTSGTLKLNVDEKGLKYEFDIPETSYGKDLAINMKNGNITQSSFAFTVAENGDEWSTDENGNDVRTITKIDKLYDVSPVTYPAYRMAESDLVIAQRGLACYKETQRKEDEEKDLVARSLAKLKIELIKRN
tara:strand:+ start:436 stop:1392 length:957 start_codon:yes stop_codon:yes gene_type:complete